MALLKEQDVSPRIALPSSVWFSGSGIRNNHFTISKIAVIYEPNPGAESTRPYIYAIFGGRWDRTVHIASPIGINGIRIRAEYADGTTDVELSGGRQLLRNTTLSTLFQWYWLNVTTRPYLNKSFAITASARPSNAAQYIIQLDPDKGIPNRIIFDARRDGQYGAAVVVD